MHIYIEAVAIYFCDYLLVVTAFHDVSLLPPVVVGRTCYRVSRENY